MIVEAHAVDDGVSLGQAEHSRFWIARLCAWRDGSYLDKTETEIGEPIDGFAIFVETRGKTDPVREIQPHDMGGR